MWRIKLVRSTEKRMPDCFNGQFCEHVQKVLYIFCNVFGLGGLWQREYLVDKTAR